MGYQDRDYFRHHQSPYLDLIRSTRVCWAIVIAHVALYLCAVLIRAPGFSLAEHLRLDPRLIAEGWQWYRLVTAGFVVDGPWHLVFALALLWVMGHELEVRLGARELFFLYFASLVLSNLSQALTYLFLIPDAAVYQAGPAGAVMAVMLLATLHDPQRMTSTLLLPMPLWAFAALMVVIDLFYFLRDVPPPLRVAVHAAPIAFALAYFRSGVRLFRPWPYGRMRQENYRRQLAPVFSAQPKPSGTLEEDRDEPTAVAIRCVDEQLEAKLDTVLEKVGKTGMDSLTPAEKNILQRASEILRHKRR